MAEDSQDIERPQRWDVPFQSELPETLGAPMFEQDVERMLQIPLFRKMDASRFPKNTSLHDILLNDSRLRRFKAGDIIVRQGDYGNSAFIVLSGSARVILDKLGGSVTERQETNRKSVFNAFAQWWRNPKMPEVRGMRDRTPKRAGGQTEFITRSEAVFVQDINAIIKDKRTVDLPAGELFGEIAALSRTARTTTVIAGADAEMLEIRWQGLREIRLRAPEFKEYIDKLYRDHSLKNHLRETAMFRHLDDATLELVAAATEFLTFGNFEWYATYSKIREATASERIHVEPMVAQEGHYPNGVYLVRSGFARLSEAYNNVERTVSYLGRGQIYGFEEAVSNWKDKTDLPFQRTLRAVGYVDVLFVPTPVLEQHVFPSLPASEFPRPHERAARGWNPDSLDTKISSEMMEFIVEQRFINGTAAMIIDMDRCTRCDDCVRACAAAHDNNPRFLRHGPIEEGFMIANACMHCQDPVCMIGCPTGAIHRKSSHGQVVINDLTCIGCATCANSCPYNNIQMVTARNTDGQPYYDKATNQPIQKAAKCDLCSSQITGPACANACPHDALVRMDMRSVEKLADWMDQR